MDLGLASKPNREIIAGSILPEFLLSKNKLNLVVDHFKNIYK